MLMFAGSLAGSLFTLSVEGSSEVKPFAEDLQAREPAFSPDGKWLAYVSRDPGLRAQVYVQPFPPTGIKSQVSMDGGSWPLWSRDGTQLYYWEGGSDLLFAVDVQTQPTFRPGKPVMLPIGATPGGVVARNYDITPDGRFVVIRPVSTTTAPNQWSTQQINVVLNWFEELKARMAAKR
jgi:serine/threonine-protein kinase